MHAWPREIQLPQQTVKTIDEKNYVPGVKLCVQHSSATTHIIITYGYYSKLGTHIFQEGVEAF